MIDGAAESEGTESGIISIADAQADDKERQRRLRKPTIGEVEDVLNAYSADVNGALRAMAARIAMLEGARSGVMERVGGAAAVVAADTNGGDE